MNVNVNDNEREALLHEVVRWADARVDHARSHGDCPTPEQEREEERLRVRVLEKLDVFMAAGRKQSVAVGVYAESLDRQRRAAHDQLDAIAAKLHDAHELLAAQSADNDALVSFFEAVCAEVNAAHKAGAASIDAASLSGMVAACESTREDLAREALQ